MKRVYLAGPINGCTDDECMTWRDWFKGCSDPIEWVDPMVRDYRGMEQDEYREIVELDKRDIKSCDIVIVNYHMPSVGTSMEVLYAWERRIPVIVIDESSTPISPWLRYHSTSIVKNKGEALGKVLAW